MLIDRVRSGIDRIDGMDELMTATEYVPPHKMVGYVPYDGVVGLANDDWNEDDIAELFDENGVPYDKVIGVGENDDPRIETDRLAWVKFRETHQ